MWCSHMDSISLLQHYSLVHTDHLDGSYFIEDCPRQAIRMGEDTDCIPTSSRQQCGFRCHIWSETSCLVHISTFTKPYSTVSLDDRFLSTQRRRSNSDAIVHLAFYTPVLCWRYVYSFQLECIYTFLVCELLVQNIQFARRTDLNARDAGCS
jgi:hypothetical protein